MEQTEEVVAKPKKSNGQIFKEKNGYSKSMKRNMQKYDYETLDEYRQFRIRRKKELTVKRQEKHATKKALRGAKVKK